MSLGDGARKLLKVAWLSLPLGAFVTLLACIFVFWWQGLSYSDTYARAILINGEYAISDTKRLYIIIKNYYYVFPPCSFFFLAYYLAVTKYVS